MNKARLGGVLGIAYCIAGFFLIFLGWNGAATYDQVAAQMPYIVSGGIGGLGLIVLGSALIVTQSLRADQAELRGTLDDLRAAVERGGVGGVERAGRGGCQWGDGDGRSDELPPARRAESSRGRSTSWRCLGPPPPPPSRTPCRVCTPDAPTLTAAS